MSRGLVSLGKVVSTHALKGKIKVKTYSGKGDSFFRNAILFFGRDNDLKSFKLLSFSPFKNLFILSLDEVDDISVAESLVGAELLIDRRNLPELNQNEAYWIDLIGSKVYSQQGVNLIGEVKEILETGGTDILAIGQIDGKELLIPFAEDFIKKIDKENKTIYVEIKDLLYES